MDIKEKQGAPKGAPKVPPTGAPALDLAPMAPAEGSEAVEQSKLRKALDRADLLWCHVPNGELRDPIIAGRLCSLGVKAGVPDLLIFSRCPWFPEARGVAIELKVKGGRVSPDQRRWHEELKGEGWIVGIAWSAAEAIQCLENVGFEIPPEPPKPTPKPRQKRAVDSSAVLGRLASPKEPSSC